jgi:FkbM family methyltransferase
MYYHSRIKSILLLQLKLYWLVLKKLTYYFAAILRFKSIFLVIRFLFSIFPKNIFVLLLINTFDPNAIRKRTLRRIKNTKIKCVTSRGEIYNLNLNEHIDWVTFIYRSFDDLYITLIDNLYEKSGKRYVFLDIGANFGSVCIPIAREYTVLAFEPQTDLFNRCVEHSSMNNALNMTIENIALSSDLLTKKVGGITKLYKPPGNSGAASFSIDWNPSLAKSEVISVKVTTLDTYLKGKSYFGRHDNTLMKIDVEGEELSVLEGSSDFINIHRPIVILEYRVGLLRQRKNELLKFLSSLPNYSSNKIIINKENKIYIDELNSEINSFAIALIPREQLHYFNFS